MTVKIDEDNLKKGLLGLVITLVEIIKDALEHQAIRRMELGRLTGEEVEKLGNALIDLDDTIRHIKKENDLEDTVNSINGDLDKIVNSAIGEMDIQNEGKVAAYE
ncbi:MAG: gas vesicle protein K [Candidatus Aenigmarchaeota archaeon]|nr:gas vesicle protein K [Candidatus Aenigmarchaeota archaeon]